MPNTYEALESTFRQKLKLLEGAKESKVAALAKKAQAEAVLVDIDEYITAAQAALETARTALATQLAITSPESGP